MILLGMLADKPRYGYEIKQYLDSSIFGEYVKLSGGGLYYNLHKLLKDGHIEEREVEREANYPDRHIYQITASGKEYLVKLVRDLLSDTSKRIFFDPIDAALAYSRVLPKAEVLARLQRQADGFRAKLIQLEVLREPLKKVEVIDNPWAFLTLDHSIHRLRSDVEWLDSVIEQISSDPNFDKVYHADPTTIEAKAENEADPRVQRWNTFEANVQSSFQYYADKFRAAWHEYDVRLSLPQVSETILSEAKTEYQRKVEAAQRNYQKALEEARIALEQEPT